MEKLFNQYNQNSNRITYLAEIFRKQNSNSEQNKSQKLKSETISTSYNENNLNRIASFLKRKNQTILLVSTHYLSEL